jgi:hypothetical protein
MNLGVPHMYRSALLAAVAALSIASAAQAAPTLLTSDAGYAGPELDLSGYDTGDYNFTFGPVTVGEFTFTADIPNSNSGQGAVVGQGGYGLGDNGSFGGDAVYIGIDGPGGYGQLLGTTAYSAIGFYFNYCPRCGDSPFISTLDISGNVMSTFFLDVDAPISTPGGFNQFQFRGIQNDTADIYGLRFGGAYILAAGSASGDVVGGVPEPATWAMMLIGFGSLGAVLRRRRQGLALAGF